MVPFNFGCGSAVLAAIATLAPSRAARSAMARPMPRLAPEMNSVLPCSDVIAPAPSFRPRMTRGSRDHTPLIDAPSCPESCADASLPRRFGPARTRVRRANQTVGRYQDGVGRGLSHRLEHLVTL